jgi:hypothetical protein
MSRSSPGGSTRQSVHLSIDELSHRPSPLSTLSRSRDASAEPTLRPSGIYIELPRLSKAERSKYKSVSDRDIPLSIEPQEILGEYYENDKYWYFARHLDGLAYKVCQLLL